MKRLVLTTALALGLCAAPARADYYLPASTAGHIIMQGTLAPAMQQYAGAFAYFGIGQCPSYTPVCWRYESSTYQDLNRTGPRTVWGTANHFAFTTNGGRYRTRWRARAWCSTTGECRSDSATPIEGPVQVP